MKKSYIFTINIEGDLDHDEHYLATEIAQTIAELVVPGCDVSVFASIIAKAKVEHGETAT